MKNMKKLLALLLCLVLAVTCAVSVFAEGESSGEPAAAEPISVGRYVTFNSTGLVTIYNAVDGQGFNSMASALSDSFIALYQYAGADGSIWYELDTSNWPEAYQNNKFVKAADVTLGELVESDPVTPPAQSITDPETGIQVSGNIPEGTSLSVEVATLEEIQALDTSLAGVPENCLAFDISLLKDNAEYQPGEAVTVTMDASGLGHPGEDVLVYHVHENEDGTVTPEILGPFQVDENGNVAFAMNSFSYVLVFSGKVEHSIENVKVFYPVLEAPSGNAHYQFLGIYYDENDDLHFLLATCDKTPSETESKFVSFYIDGQQYIVSTMGENVKKVEVQTYSKVEFKDSETNAVMDAVNITENKGIAKGFYDVNVGNKEVGQNFGFAISQDSNMPSGSQAWNINGVVTVDLDYELIKTVAAGTSATIDFTESVTVERGEWVIFKINVNNKGERPLTDMLVQDNLPADVFDMSTVQMSIDGENGAIGNWQPFNSTLLSNYDSEGHFSRLLYIKAQVDPDLQITTDTTYINKATIDGMNMPTYEDTASVVVKAPSTGTLTVSKAVTSENPNDPAPDTTFTFTLHSDAANADSFSYTKSNGTTGTVENNGTFTLKNGESIEFADFPVGRFTVTETDAAGFATKVNGNSGTVYSGEMTSLAAPVVAFENQFSMRMAALTITKQVEKDYDNDVPEIPEGGFAFTVTIGDGTDTTTEYPYTIGQTTGAITSGSTIKLGAGETAVISNIPVGTSYTVTEVLGDLSDDYETTVNGIEGNTVSGTLAVGGTQTAFVNTYLQHFTDLTITKTGAEEIDENQSFIFEVSGPDNFKITVTVNGNGSVTIKNLPFGTYTVAELSDWSWRYTPTYGSQEITLQSNPALNILTFENNRTEIYWLSGDSFNENQFTVNNG